MLGRFTGRVKRMGQSEQVASQWRGHAASEIAK